jgi:hypothetical protein
MCVFSIRMNRSSSDGQMAEKGQNRKHVTSSMSFRSAPFPAVPPNRDATAGDPRSSWRVRPSAAIETGAARTTASGLSLCLRPRVDRVTIAGAIQDQDGV